MAKSGRRKTNRMSVDELSYLVHKSTGYTRDDCRYIIRAFLQEIENQIKNGHNIALGMLGYMDAKWCKPHLTKYGSMARGHYLMRFKYTRRLKQYIKGLEEGDFDYSYIDEYPDGIVTENGILRKRREDEEFFNDED